MIEASDLRKDYGEVQALDGIGFDVAPGTIFGLLGPNGAGKSTTVKVLTTLARPDAGEARVAGHDVLREAARVRRSIGVVAQQLRRRPRPDRPREPQAPGPPAGPARARAHRTHRRAARAVRPCGLGSPCRARLLRRHAAAPGHRDGARPPAEGAVPRRADHRARSRGPRGDVAEIERMKADEGLTILLTTHYMEEADRLASQPRDRRPRPRGRPGLARRAQGRPEGRRRPRRARRRQRQRQRPVGAGAASPASARCVVEGRTLHARADDGARAVPAVLARSTHTRFRSRR